MRVERESDGAWKHAAHVHLDLRGTQDDVGQPWFHCLRCGRRIIMTTLRRPAGESHDDDADPPSPVVEGSVAGQNGRSRK